MARFWSGLNVSNRERDMTASILSRARKMLPPQIGTAGVRCSLDCFAASFACADSNALFQWQDKYLAVSHLALAGTCASKNGFNRRLDVIVIHADGDLRLAYHRC